MWNNEISIDFLTKGFKGEILGQSPHIVCGGHTQTNTQPKAHKYLHIMLIQLHLSLIYFPEVFLINAYCE